MTRYIPELTRRALIISCALFVFGSAVAANAQTSPGIASDTAAAVKLYERNETDAAIVELKKITARRPDDADAWQYLGLSFKRRGELRQAAGAFDRAMNLRPEDTNAIGELVSVLVLGSDIPRAGALANLALTKGADTASLHYAIAEASREAGNDTRALEEANAALRLDALYADALLTKARALRSLHRTPEAVTALELYLATNPEDEDTPLWRDELRRWSESTQPSTKEAVMSAPGVYKSNEVVVKARIIRKPQPQYTEKARRAGVNGTVKLQLVLSSTGEVRDIRVVQWLRSGLTNAAVNAARAIKFEPATIDGKPVSQYIKIEYNFSIF